MKKYVFDTSALLTYIENEDGVDTVEKLIFKALNNEEDTIFISTVSIIEVYYISIQEQGQTIAEERINLIETLPLTQVSLSPTIARLVGEIKAANSMSFADCCIAGLSKRKNAILVHKDPEFEQILDEIKQLKLPYKNKKKNKC
ncbi:PilT domain protein [Candidatus Magnetomorum sp. HK-1]|nr:PilT domain protein [Candidatus Magnetomorum sp. HK-1]